MGLPVAKLISATQIAKALEDCAGNRRAAAIVLGISRGTLYTLLRKHGFSKQVKQHRGEPISHIARLAQLGKQAADERIESTKHRQWPPREPDTDAWRIEKALVRDLSTCTREEMFERWDEGSRVDAEEAMERSWESLVPEDHNPAYYVAERCWFDNKADDPRFLYKPYHLVKLCVPVIAYLLDQPPPEFPPTETPVSADDESGLLWLGPRHSFKSTFFHGVFPMTILLRARHLHGDDLRVVLRHHKFSMASRNLKRLRNKFAKHDWVRKYWAEACPPPDDKRFGTGEEFSLCWVPPASSIAEASVRAIGATGEDTGSHGDIDFNDDLVTREHRDSLKIRQESLAQYDSRRYQAEPGTGKDLTSGTPYHPRDLHAKMRKANVEGRAIYRVYAFRAREADGLSLPNRLTEEFLRKRMQEEISRSGNDDMWFLQYQCEAREGRRAATDASWIRSAKLSDIPAEAWPVITVDPAWKGTHNQGKGDSASIQVWFVATVNGLVLRWLADGAHSNELTSDDGVSTICRLCKKYDITSVAPEERGGFAFRTALANAAVEKGLSLDILTLKTQQVGKDQRIGAWLRELQSGRIFLCDECDPDLLEQLRDQIIEYPLIDHDDAIDAAAYTCDPNIAEAWVPKVRRPSRPWMVQKKEEYRPQLTRHCGY